MPHPLPPDVAALHAAWRARGDLVTLDEGHRLFAVQEGRGPDLVLVHGFPSTSYDWAHVLPALRERFRVTAFDQLGFGFSDKPAAASYSLLDQGRRAGELGRRLGVASAHVLGHDMGLTVAVEMLCRAETGDLGFALGRLVLCNGSHLVELAHLTPFQQAIMTDEGAAAFVAGYDPERFATALRFVWGDQDRAPAADLRALAWWLEANDGLAVLGRIARYNIERTTYADRWRPILGRTRVPIDVIWGDRDPIAVLEIGRRLAAMSGGSLTVLDGVGHFPQVEAPERFLAALLPRLARP